MEKKLRRVEEIMHTRLVGALLVQYFLLVRSENENHHDAATSGITSSDEDDRIIGGTAAENNQFPWQVYITFSVNNQGYACGGSIIAPRWILTAAHCTARSSIFEITVSATNLRKKEPGVTRYVTDLVHTHAEYNNETIENDIALLELRTPIYLGRPTSMAAAINLPRWSDMDRSFEGVTAVVSGWGQTEDGGPGSAILNYVSLPVISNEECIKDYKTMDFDIYNSMICTSARNGTTTTCKGDSGGPLIYKERGGLWTQIGVVSFGFSKCQQEPAAVYTRVTSYLSWISNLTNIPIRRYTL